MRKGTLLALSLLALTACSSSGSGTTGTSSTTGGGAGGSGGGAGGDDAIVGGDRPVEVIVPSSYDKTKPAPLLLLLHGYSVNGNVEELYFQLAPLAEKYGFLYAYPTGTIDQSGQYFWNATDGCCNFYGSDVDDSAYLSSLITEIEGKFSVDPRRVYLAGHSNGGFMSYRMACDHADQIAGIVSLAGAMWFDTSKCKPSGPVSVVQLHGTMDAEVPYDGDAMSLVPSAASTIADWAGYDGCDAMGAETAMPLDADATIAGAETTVERHAKGCEKGSAVELWTIDKGTHVPGLTTEAREGIFAFLMAHPKP
ncbi:MAG: PHB depolymerase family esterase [Byssovorax sp.]